MPNLRIEYEQGASIPKLASKHGLPRSRVRVELIKSGCKLRTRAEGIRQSGFPFGHHLKGKKKGPASEQTKQRLRDSLRARHDAFARGTTISSRGYIRITRGPNKDRLLHTVLVEQQIGRRIKPGEVVHHIDGNKQNNSLHNLTLMTNSEHVSLHRRHAKS